MDNILSHFQKALEIARYKYQHKKYLVTQQRCSVLTASNNNKPALWGESEREVKLLLQVYLLENFGKLDDLMKAGNMMIFCPSEFWLALSFSTANNHTC